jgi:hypothetical protein
LYTRNHSVGIVLETVYVMFDPGVREWPFADEEGRPFGRQAATKLSREDNKGLKVTRRDNVT